MMIAVNRLTVDWFSFSVRYDDKSSVIPDKALNLEFFCDLLELPKEDFVDVGRVSFYRECHKLEGISINVPFEEKEGSQGYFIVMSGQGCRYYEQACRKDLYTVPADVWRKLFSKLRTLTKHGFAVNIPRFDVAMDDFSGLLQMERLVECVKNGEVCSRFDKKRILDDIETYYKEKVRIQQSYSHGLTGMTLTFGARTSRSMCRFYDKLAEQRMKSFGNEMRMKELGEISHWVRMEFEFHKVNAIAMVNEFIDSEDFTSFFVDYVNGILRFIDRDDCNVSRCTPKQWWTQFLGTVRRLTLSLGEWRPVTRERHLDYVYKNLSGSIYTAINIDGLDSFLEHIIQRASEHLKSKHRALCRGLEFNLKNLCSADLWDYLRPHYKEAFV